MEKDEIHRDFERCIAYGYKEIEEVYFEGANKFMRKYRSEYVIHYLEKIRFEEFSAKDIVYGLYACDLVFGLKRVVGKDTYTRIMALDTLRSLRMITQSTSINDVMEEMEIPEIDIPQYRGEITKRSMYKCMMRWMGVGTREEYEGIPKKECEEYWGCENVREFCDKAYEYLQNDEVEDLYLTELLMKLHRIVGYVGKIEGQPRYSMLDYLQWMNHEKREEEEEGVDYDFIQLFIQNRWMLDQNEFYALIEEEELKRQWENDGKMTLRMGYYILLCVSKNLRLYSFSFVHRVDWTEFLRQCPDSRKEILLPFMMERFSYYFSPKRYRIRIEEEKFIAYLKDPLILVRASSSLEKIRFYLKLSELYYLHHYSLMDGVGSTDPECLQLTDVHRYIAYQKLAVSLTLMEKYPTETMDDCCRRVQLSSFLHELFLEDSLFFDLFVQYPFDSVSLMVSTVPSLHVALGKRFSMNLFYFEFLCELVARYPVSRSLEICSELITWASREMYHIEKGEMQRLVQGLILLGNTFPMQSSRLLDLSRDLFHKIQSTDPSNTDMVDSLVKALINKQEL